MTSPPQLWLKDCETAEPDTAPGTPHSGRNSLSESNEQQFMLENMAGAPMRSPNGLQDLPPGAEPPNATTLRLSSSTPSFEPPGTDSVPTPFRMSRASSSKSIRAFPSPLNPAHQNAEKISTPTTSPFNSFIRPPSSQSSFLNRIPSEDIRALAGSTAGNRGSFMILYRRADLDDGLLPPTFPGSTKRPNSFSSDVRLSLSSDSKYPSGLMSEHGLVAYAYDPSMDERDPLDEEDMLHNPDEKTAKIDGPVSWRGLKNIGMLGTLIAALLCLFVVYPVYTFYRSNGRNARIVGNTKINATGQADLLKVARSQLPIFAAINTIDPQTPEDVRTRFTSNGYPYTLVFSDEFKTAGRVFSSVDELWSHANEPNHEHLQATTQDGNLVLGIDQRGGSAVLRQRVPVCLGEGGYVEINATLPHSYSHSLFFWSGRWSASPSANFIPEVGQASRHPTALSMTLKYIYSAAPGSAALLIDYIRIYQRGSPTDVYISCNDDPSSITSITFPW